VQALHRTVSRSTTLPVRAMLFPLLLDTEAVHSHLYARNRQAYTLSEASGGQQGGALKIIQCPVACAHAEDKLRGSYRSWRRVRKMGGLRVFLLVARSVYCISYYFWQFLIMAVGLILAEEPGTFIYDWQSAGPPGDPYIFWSFWNTSSLYRHSLLCTYCTNSRSRGI
jgi:hypothetical protein